MSIEAWLAITTGGIVVLAAIVLVYRRLPKRLKQAKFAANWQELQAYCKDKTTWSEALISADRLLDKALKKRNFKGKTMGERLVSAQRSFTNNDNVWYAHNLYKKIITDGDVRLKETEVKTALVGFRQALRDVGALPGGEPQDSK